MMKKMIVKSMALLAMMCMTSGQVSAQGFFSKLSKGLDKATEALDKVSDATKGSTDNNSATEANDTAAVKPLKWDMIPKYHAEKRQVTAEDGTALTNEDGTPMVRVFLVDQFGKVRSAEAVKEQHKKLNKAVGNILLKVGAGAAVGIIGGLKAAKGKAAGGIIGGAVGAGAGVLLSKDDIKMAKQQKKSLKEQEKLIEQYQKNFTNEGTPIDASVDIDKIEDLEVSEGVSMTAESLKAELESEEFNTTDDSAWEV